MTACASIVPADTPAQLVFTPGALVVVTDSTFDGDVFAVDYPSSWRVVKTSIASAEALQVVFVAPDTSTLTITQVDAAGETSDTEQWVTLENGVTVQILIDPAVDADPTFETLSAQIIASLRVGQ